MVSCWALVALLIAARFGGAGPLASTARSSAARALRVPIITDGDDDGESSDTTVGVILFYVATGVCLSPVACLGFLLLWSKLLSCGERNPSAERDLAFERDLAGDESVSPALNGSSSEAPPVIRGQDTIPVTPEAQA